MKPLDHSPALQVPPGRTRPPSEHLEHDARQALELRAGRTFGDREWAQMRSKLVEFYAILRDLDKEASERERIRKTG